MNQYERENVEQIKKDLKEYEEKNGKMPQEKMAYYIYRRMGQIYSYKEAYHLLQLANIKDYMKKIEIHREGTSEQGEAICTDMNGGCVECMQEMGINAKNLAIEADATPLYHADACFEVNGKYYFFNLTSDVMRIQTGMRVRHFGVSQERLAERFGKGIPGVDRLYLLYRMNEENDGEPFSEIPEETIEKWDEEFGFSYKGLYTNDVLEMMKKECFDPQYMAEFFGTDKPDELVQKKFEFVMKYIGIVGAERKRRVGNVEALEYYLRLSKSMLTKQEIDKYIELCAGLVEENGKRKAKNIVVIKKEKENVYYLYNQEKQVYEKIEKEELIKQKIQYQEIEKDTYATKTIDVFINSKEERFLKPKDKNSEDIEL